MNDPIACESRNKHWWAENKQSTQDGVHGSFQLLFDK